MKPIIVISTYPSKSAISAISKKLVQDKVVACVNICEISSVYSWKGKIQDTSEYMAIFKTVPKKKSLLKKILAETHPYDVPEIVEIDVMTVNDSYYKWLVESTS